MNRLSLLPLVALLLAPAAAAAADAAKLPPIKAVKGVTPRFSVYKAAKWNKPLVLRSARDAATYFSKDELAKLSKQADFKHQFVLVFAWRGSGQDRLDYSIAESFPEQIAFRMKRGLTRDLRSHVRMYVLRANVKWSVK